MLNLIKKPQKIKSPGIKGKLCSLGVAALCVMSSAASAFAEETSSSVDYSTITSSLTSGITECVNNCISLATAIIPICVGMWGLTHMINWAKKFFNKAG